jgi:hypothetical protein
MVNQNIGRGLLLAAVALVFLFQAPLAILTPCERALRAERWPHHELDSSVRTQLNRVAVDGDRCGRAPRLASGCSLSGNGL